MLPKLKLMPNRYSVDASPDAALGWAGNLSFHSPPRREDKSFAVRLARIAEESDDEDPRIALQYNRDLLT